MSKKLDTDYERIENVELPDQIGVALNSLRKKCDLTQKQLADSISISESYINSIENNQKIPAPQLFLKMLMFFFKVEEGKYIIKSEKVIPMISGKNESRVEKSGVEENLNGKFFFKSVIKKQIDPIFYNLVSILYNPITVEDKSIQDLFLLWVKNWTEFRLKEVGIKLELIEDSVNQRKSNEQKKIASLDQDIRLELEKIRQELEYLKSKSENGLSANTQNSTEKESQKNRENQKSNEDQETAELPGSICSVIKKLRKERNLSQKELADNLDISESYVNLIENNQKIPAMEFFLKMLIFFFKVEENKYIIKNEKVIPIMTRKKIKSTEERSDSEEELEEENLKSTAKKQLDSIFNNLVPILYNPRTAKNKLIQDIFLLWVKNWTEFRLKKVGIKLELIEDSVNQRKSNEQEKIASPDQDIRLELEKIRQEIEVLKSKTENELSGNTKNLNEKVLQKSYNPDTDYLNYFEQPMQTPKKSGNAKIDYTPLTSTDPDIKIEYI